MQILALSVLIPSSESVGTQCIRANVYNAQHGMLEDFFLSEPSSTSDLRMCNKYQNLVHRFICACVYISGSYFSLPSPERITSKVIYLKKKKEKRKENQFLKTYK